MRKLQLGVCVHDFNYFYFIYLNKIKKRIILHFLLETGRRRPFFNGVVLSLTIDLGEYQSGQLGQTVNLLTYVFVGSNPASPTR